MVGLGKDKEDAVEEGNKEALITDAEKGHDHQHEEHHKHSHKKKKFATEGDTLDQYGFGMVAYKDLMFTMIWLFALLSIFMIPAMYYYSQGTGIGTYKSWSQFSLGNFGYSTSKCQVSPYDLGSLPIKCQYG